MELIPKPFLGPNITEVTINDLQAGTKFTIRVYNRIEDHLSVPAEATVKTKVYKGFQS